MKKVAVIIVTYNGIQLIDRCLKSILASTISCDIIIIDNASKDGTKEFINEKYRRITFIGLKKNIGFGNANNKGLAIALRRKYDYVFLLNQDTEVYKDTIEELIKVSEKNKDYGIISPVHLNATKNVDHSFKYYFKNYGSDQMLTDLLLRNNIQEIYSFKMINAAAWLLPLKTLRTVGGFHPMFFLYGEDDNFCQRVLFHGLKIGVSPFAYMIHYSENNNLTQPKRGSEEFFEKFQNQIKVKYADINTDNYKLIPQLKSQYFRRALIFLIKLDFLNFRIHLKKGRIISKMNFKQDVQENRKKKPTYLDVGDTGEIE